MIEMVLGSSYSSIKGLNPKQEKSLIQALSYTVGGSSAYFSGFGVKRKSLLSKRGEFPTGLLSRVANIIIDWPGKVKITDNRVKPTYKPRHEALVPEPYEWQIKALEAAIKADRGIISATTGSGKSRVIQMIASHYSLKTLVVVPSLEIKRQLQDTLKDLPNVIVENIDARSLMKLTGIDVLIIDEAHHSAAKTYQKLNRKAWHNIFYRFFLTATAFRNDAEETLLFEAIAGDLIYSLDYKEAVNKGYVVPIESYYIDVPKQETDAETYPQVYSQLVVHNETRNQLIAYLLLTLENKQIPTLCLVKEISHGKILSELTGIAFVNGADEESRDYIRQFNSGEIKALIGTEGVLAEGVDTKPAEWVIITGLGRAKSRFMQSVGRVLRRHANKESGKVILIKDRSHRFLARHFASQAAILKEVYNSVPEKLDV